MLIYWLRLYSLCSWLSDYRSLSLLFWSMALSMVCLSSIDSCGFGKFSL